MQILAPDYPLPRSRAEPIPASEKKPGIYIHFCFSPVQHVGARFANNETCRKFLIDPLPRKKKRLPRAVAPGKLHFQRSSAEAPFYLLSQQRQTIIYFNALIYVESN